jgi:hypothetical protein
VSDFLKPQSVGTFGPSAAALVLEDVVTTVLDIVYHAWPQVVAGGRVTSQGKEDEITNDLRWEMDAEKKRRNPVPQLRFEREVQSDRPGQAEDLGHIDVFVIYSFDQQEYFAIECKRVADADRTLARKYVTLGVIDRFVSGKYSREHPFAAMVGYVCAGACGEVAGQIANELCEYDTQQTAMSAEWSWKPEERFGKLPHLFSSKHTRSGTTSDLTLFHLFVAFTN